MIVYINNSEKDNLRYLSKLALLIFPQQLYVDENISDFDARVEREGKRRGFDKDERKVILGDGAK